MSIDASQVASNLWVGGWSAARDYREQFDVVVNCAQDAPHNGDYQFNLVDGPGNDPAEFAAAVACVRKALEEDKKVLVHCVAGMSRSLTVAARAASDYTGVPVAVVLERFRLSRGCDSTRPNCPHDAMLALAGAL